MSKAKPYEAAVDSLELHPELARLPMLPEQHADFKALVASVLEEGRVWTPLVLDENGLVIDGRHRLAAAKIAGLKTVPVVSITGASVEKHVFESLFARRHLGAGSRAYLGLRYLRQCAENGKRVRGQSSNLNFEGETLTQALLRLGIPKGTYHEASAAFDQLEALPPSKAKLRAKIEADIISGDIGLSRVASAIAGHNATAGKDRSDPKPELLIPKAFRTLQVQAKTWDKLKATTREKILIQVSEISATWPAEWISAISNRKEGQP